MGDLFKYPIIIASILLCVPFLFRRILARWRPSHLPPLPPGPKGYPIIGNLLDIGNNKPWDNYSRIAKEYGDIVYLEALGTKVLLLSSVKTTTDLLEGKSSIYSDRPHLPMLHGQMKFDLYFANMRYGHMWRRQRREFYHHFNPTVIPQYHPLISREGVRFVQKLAASPERFVHHIENYFNRIIVKSTYGFDVLDHDDPFVSRGVEVMEGFITAGVPGTFVIDLVPALQYLPSWMPGTAGWRSYAEHFRALSVKARDEPFQRVLKQYNEGTAEPSIATRMIERLPDRDDPTWEEEEVIARDTLATTYLAGYDTSLAAGRSFILAMARYPEFQKRAQAEIDEVVGFGQIPTFEDRPKLVYVEALLREVFRWHRLAPLGVPHATSEDDIYDGYFIPKGTIVIANAWSILTDPDHYSNPSEFDPGRHIKDGMINPDAFDPFAAAFGFGRRICPGRFMALDTLYTMATSTLATLDVSAPKDENGNSTLNCSFNSQGVIRAPEPFDCVITPRSVRHAQFIQSL